jgi:hypothetical protein
MKDQPKIRRGGCDDPGFQLLVSRLDHELWNELKEDLGTYDQYNSVKGLQTAVIAYVGTMPAAIGCFKEFSKDTVEIKRMFVDKEFRGKGLSKRILSELEQWAIELGYHYAVLETSVRFEAARQLYAGEGYIIIENYDQYKGLTESVCMKKELKPHVPEPAEETGNQEARERSSFIKRKDIEYFAFEENFVEGNIRCIPMIVRFKMDKAGIKLKLREWNKFSEAERVTLATMPCVGVHETKDYYEYLDTLIRDRAGNHSTRITVDQQPGWDNLFTVPSAIAEKMSEIGLAISVQQWKTLTQMQRFALMKLSRPGHESKNFPVAVKEFGLMSRDQNIGTGIIYR